jgi:hypothetical protein
MTPRRLKPNQMIAILLALIFGFLLILRLGILESLDMSLLI